MLDRSIPAAVLDKSRVQASFSRAASSYDEWAVLQCSAIRDGLSRSGLQNPILEREIMRVHYKDVMELMRALKGIGAHNVNSGRSRALTAKRKVARMIAAYRTINATQTISATFELIFGRCGRSGAPNGAE